MALDDAQSADDAKPTDATDERRSKQLVHADDDGQRQCLVPAAKRNARYEFNLAATNVAKHDDDGLATQPAAEHVVDDEQQPTSGSA